MIGKEIVSSKPITVSEVKEILEEQKAGREMGFEQQATLDYAQKLAKHDAKHAQKLVVALGKIERITPDLAVKIVDMMPANKEQLLVIVSKERYTLNEKEVEQVLGALHGKESAKEKKEE